MPKVITKTAYTFDELLEAAKDGNDKLAAKAAQRASDWLQQGDAADKWWECTYEQWEAALSQIGFENADISFSGFSSQGDGASFKADVDLPKLISFLSVPREGSDVVTGEDGKEDFRNWLVKKCGGVHFDPKYSKITRFVDACEMSVERHSSRYSHERTCGVTSEFPDTGEYADSGEFKGGYPVREWVSNQPRMKKLWGRFVEDAEELRLDLSRAIYKSLEDEYDYLTGEESLKLLAEANGYLFLKDGTFEGSADE